MGALALKRQTKNGNEAKKKTEKRRFKGKISSQTKKTLKVEKGGGPPRGVFKKEVGGNPNQGGRASPNRPTWGKKMPPAAPPKGPKELEG